MRYNRVIPRDLFNEANLLKCYGRLWICLDDMNNHGAILGDGDSHGVLDDHSGDPFVICQNDTDGSTYIANVRLTVHGQRYYLRRPLNSRNPWPLWCEHPYSDEFEPIEVFTDEGYLSSDFLNLIEAQLPTGEA